MSPAFTESSNDSCDYYDMNKSWVPPYLYTISALGIVLNLLVLLVFLLHKKNCTATELYLSNMAAADLLLVLFLPIWGMYESNDHVWTFGRPMCTFISLLLVINYNTSIYFLVLVCIDRYLALVHPLLQCKLRRRKYAKLGCFLVWCFGLLLNVPTLMCRQAVAVPHNETHNTEEYTCRWNCSMLEYMTNEVIQTLAAFVIPLLIILFCTIKIVQALRRRPTQQESTLQTEHKATILVLAVLLAFVICWAEFSIIRMFEVAVRFDIIEKTCTIKNILNICRPLFLNFGFFNSVLNPILYVLVGKNFRKKLQEVVRSHSSVMWKSSTQFATSTSNLYSHRVNANAVK